MQFELQEQGRAVFSGTSCDYEVEVDHGGWGGELATGMLVSIIIRAGRRRPNNPAHWEVEHSAFVSLDKEAAAWLSESVARVVSGQDAGLKRHFSRVESRPTSV